MILVNLATWRQLVWDTDGLLKFKSNIIPNTTLSMEFYNGIPEKAKATAMNIKRKIKNALKSL